MSTSTNSFIKNFATEAVVHTVSQFLGYEAMLLDERRFWDWFALLEAMSHRQLKVGTAGAA
ncbi:hypothetical protein BCO37747_07026 [Burkholderia contaminans]|uniref:hypothetical protein n=1 Tax=Burkholderia contaminans TaxID=488447 RepID=UPI0014542D8D|nr:hypothetical protein [Burkholderia contaminans]VWD58780.1 hypothetical protein BCO37747_07026 [Burkholderia contaminans]